VPIRYPSNITPTKGKVKRLQKIVEILTTSQENLNWVSFRVIINPKFRIFVKKMTFDFSSHRSIAAHVAHCMGFQWDEGNRDKNLKKHGVSDAEAEQIFQSRPLAFYYDLVHSVEEERFTVLGRNRGNSLRTVVFTIRDAEIRVISARPMSAKDRRLYAEATA
jgi:uncharacterized protein